eukprot:gene2650-847_t
MGRTKFRSCKPFTGRRKQVRRRKTTVCQVEGEVSASARKLSYFGVNLDSLVQQKYPKSREDEDCYLMVQLSSMQALLTALACPHCLSIGVQMAIPEGSHLGFSVKYQLNCSKCGQFISEGYLCQRIEESKSSMPFELTTRAILAFRGIGCGYSDITEWCGMMNMPYKMSHDTYSRHNAKVHEASKSCFKNVQEKSIDVIKQAYRDIGVVPDKNGILNISVSFDGTWQRRGHSSHNGVGAVIELITGLPIDYEILSNFCLKCKIAEENPLNKEDQEKHLQNCGKNFDGSANSMEAECAVRLWRRSKENFCLHYTTMLSDGDSKAYAAVVNDSPYGEDIVIEKEDCINHVSKRMGKALRDFVAICKSQKQSVSGKGKLTNEKITKIQNYYGRAIKDNTDDIDVMRKRIFAILFHMSSTDQDPKHVHCPPGESSWCFWQRALAKSVPPGGHKDHETFPTEIGKKLVPIFNRLSEVGLLKRCARGSTQNANESMHSILWKFCPKNTFCGKNTIETGVALALSQFSMGASYKNMIFQVMGIEPGKYLERSGIAKDVKRIRKAERAMTTTAKKRRKELKFKKSRSSKDASKREGKMYESGGFDV